MPDVAKGSAGSPWPGRSGTTRVLLTLTAGAANAFGFLATGVFTSVVTANSVLLGLHLGSGHLAAVRSVTVALLGYLLGVTAGSLLAAVRGGRAALGIRGALALETLVLWLVAGGWLWWHEHPGAAGRILLLFLLAVAMGCQNGGVRATAGGDVTTAYLTGLVTSATVALVTRGRLQGRNAAVVLILITGAVIGGAAYHWLRESAPVVPALFVTAAFAATWARPERQPGLPPRRRPENRRSENRSPQREATT
ncbi:YoaK family protein [Streptomyces sp. NPDC004629]|uniref:YoaK family protein n=1 Tax=Streptomyces sp. NPDC004629 TaxID=3364705 RepID=UPI0036A2FD74